MSGSESPPQPWSYESHRRLQIRRGLELSSAQRLLWLETTMEQMEGVVGRAQSRASKVGRLPDSSTDEGSDPR